MAEAAIPEALTEAESEIALSVYEGLSNREIAERRGVSVKTVGDQIESVFRKLGVLAGTTR